METQFNEHIGSWIKLHNEAESNKKIETVVYIKIKIAVEDKRNWTIEGNGFTINPKTEEFVNYEKTYFRTVIPKTVVNWEFISENDVRNIYQIAELKRKTKIFE